MIHADKECPILDIPSKWHILDWLISRLVLGCSSWDPRKHNHDNMRGVLALEQGRCELLALSRCELLALKLLPQLGHRILQRAILRGCMGKPTDFFGRFFRVAWGNPLESRTEAAVVCLIHPAQVKLQRINFYRSIHRRVSNPKRPAANMTALTA